MKKSLILFSFIFAFFPKHIKAQYHLKDTLKKEIHLRPKLLLGFDNKRSYIGNRGVKIIGLRLGAKFDKLRLFVGVYNTREPVYFNTTVGLDTTFIASKFGYLSTGFSYRFFKKKRWEFVLNSQLGIGGGEKTIRTKDTTLLQTPAIVPLEVGVTFSYYLKDWVALYAGSGLRVSLHNTSEFDGVYYSLGVKILPGVIYRKVFPKKED